MSPPPPPIRHPQKELCGGEEPFDVPLHIIPYDGDLGRTSYRRKVPTQDFSVDMDRTWRIQPIHALALFGGGETGEHKVLKVVQWVSFYRMTGPRA